MILKGVGGMRAKSKWIMTGLFLGIMIITAGTELSASGGSYSSTGNIVVRKAGADGRTEKLIEIDRKSVV